MRGTEEDSRSLDHETLMRCVVSTFLVSFPASKPFLNVLSIRFVPMKGKSLQRSLFQMGTNSSLFTEQQRSRGALFLAFFGGNYNRPEDGNDTFS